MAKISTATMRNGRMLTPLSSFAVSLFATMVVFSTFSAVAQTTEKTANKVNIKVITVQDGKTITNSASSLEEAQNNPAIKEALQKANVDLKSLTTEGNVVNINTNTTDGEGKTTTLIVNSGGGNGKAHCFVMNTSKDGTSNATTSGGGMSFVIAGDDDAEVITEDMMKELNSDNDNVMVWSSSGDGASSADASAPNVTKTVRVRVNNATEPTQATATTETPSANVEKTVIVRVNRQDGKDNSATVTKNIVIARGGMGKGMSNSQCIAVCKGNGATMASCSGKGTNVTKTTIVTKETPSQTSGSLQLSAYPNPTQGEFTLSFTAKETANTTVTVTDMAGRSVYSEQLDNFSGDYTKMLNLSEQPKGNYLVKVSQGGATAVVNIAIE